MNNIFFICGSDQPKLHEFDQKTNHWIEMSFVQYYECLLDKPKQCYRLAQLKRYDPNRSPEKNFRLYAAVFERMIHDSYVAGRKLFYDTAIKKMVQTSNLEAYSRMMMQYAPARIRQLVCKIPSDYPSEPRHELQKRMSSAVLDVLHECCKAAFYEGSLMVYHALSA